jgi:hypothetical protein
MQVQTINSTLFTQPIQTETGAPIVSLNPVPPSNVVASFNIPKDGQRPEDKHPKNKNPYQQVSEEKDVSENQQLPESFKLILSPDFSEIFQAFLEKQSTKLDQVQRLFRLSNGVRENKLFSGMYQKLPQLKQRRQHISESVLLYHYNRPGSRFVGQM